MFLLFALLTLGGALSVALQRNLVVAGLSLVVSFLGVAGLFLLLANPVAAALQIMVYSGAIVVLTLFVIMLLNTHQQERPLAARRIQRGVAVLVGLALAAGAFRLVWASPALKRLAGTPLPPSMDLGRLGVVLFREHLAAFEVVGLLLLAAMVGAVALVKRDL
jgi:NADH-quinone oxidoreductase subunit J